MWELVLLLCQVALLFVLGKAIAAQASDKGRGEWRWVLFLCGCWIGGEVGGAAVGIALTSGKLFVVLGFGYAGAAVGAVLAFTLLWLVPEVEDRTTAIIRRGLKDENETEVWAVRHQ